MSIGAILQTCAFSVPQMIVARLITGVCLLFVFRLICSVTLTSFSFPGLGNGLVPPFIYLFTSQLHALLYLKNQHGYCASMAK